MSTKSINLDDHRYGGRGEVLKEGYLKKLKTMKKKYFLARSESAEASARLEYYDSEKKYRSGQPPKRTISLKTCFNINRRTDTKYKNVIALYTKDDVFCMVLDSDKQLEEWLRLLLKLQSGDDNSDGDSLRPIFEHVWKVKLQHKGLGDSRNLVGPSFVCLSDQTLSIIKCGSKDDKQGVLEFPLTQIRSCGGTESFFYIEVGRQSVTGAGELWMLTGDPYIAKSMNAVIFSAFTLRQKDQQTDPHRKRSSSATESSRPVGLLHRRSTHSGTKTMIVSPYSGCYGFDDEGWPTSASCQLKISITPPQPTDDDSQIAVPVTSSLGPLARVNLIVPPRPGSQRRHSVSAVSSSSVLHPATVDVTDGSLPPAASNSSTAISHQRTKSCPVSDPAPVVFEPHRVRSVSHVCTPYSDRRGSGASGLRRPGFPKSSTGTRERSDSMPSRNRTTSESTHKSHMRPQSVHVRGISYSPPGPCLTDSAGSSLSIDEPDFERYPHSSTPDDRVILEENVDEALNWRNDPDLEAERLDAYVPMTRPPPSLSLPIQRKISAPGALHSSPCGSSPSDYLPMSPADSARRPRPGSSPSTSDYLPMSPGFGGSHSDSLPMSPPDNSRRVSSSGPTTSSDYLPMSPRDLNRQKQASSMDQLAKRTNESSRRASAVASPSTKSDYLMMSPSNSTSRIEPGTSPSAASDYMVLSPPNSTQSAKRSGSLSMKSEYPTTNSVDLTQSSEASSSATSDYMAMSLADVTSQTTHGTSPSATSDYLLMSPVDVSANVPIGSSPSTASDYMVMSPGSSNLRTPNTDYSPMGPRDVTRRANSRGNSLTEDGYVPMAPHHADDGYVDMDPLPGHRFMPDDHHSDMSPGSSCSVTSGTPSTDHYLLEKVPAYFTPSEEEEGSTTDRPSRTYSFGSQPKGRLEVMNAAEAARVRAFSVGTRSRPDGHKLAKRTAPPGVKFSSAPLLSSSWSGTIRYQPQDPMADLMEIDFTKKRGSRLKNLTLKENLTAQNTSSADSGYMDMSSKSPPRASPPKPPSSRHVFSPPEGKHSIGSRSIKPAIISSSTLKTIGEKPDIKPQKFPNTSSANINILPSKLNAPDKPYVDMKAGRVSRSGSEAKIDGYVDMTLGYGATRIARKNSEDGSGDYLSMSCGKSSSQPIAIKGPSSPTLRNTSSITPPKPPSFLSLGSSGGSFNPFSSIRRNPKRKSRKKQERRDSKENDVTTPTAIFPLSLNSPLSPKKAYPPEGGSVPMAASEEASTTETDASNISVPLSRVLRLCSKENSSSPDAATVIPPEEPDPLRLIGSDVQRRTSLPQHPDDSQCKLLASGRPPSSPRPPEKPPERVAPLAKPEDSRLKSDACSLETHCGVSRQVSTSSSSSTEVMSVKEGAGRDITYASLDLGSEGEEPRSPRPSPTPASSQGPFAYAEIDFQKSESLRAPKTVSKKIRH